MACNHGRVYVVTLYDDTARGAGRVQEQRYFASEASYHGQGTPEEKWCTSTMPLAIIASDWFRRQGDHRPLHHSI